MMLCQISRVVPGASSAATAAATPFRSSSSASSPTDLLEMTHGEKNGRDEALRRPSKKGLQRGCETEPQDASPWRRERAWGRLYREALRQSLAPHSGFFFLSPDDTPTVIRLKLFLLPHLLCASTARTILDEYSHYLSGRCLPFPSPASASSSTDLSHGSSSVPPPPSSSSAFGLHAPEEEGGAHQREEAIHVVIRSLAHLVLDEAEEEEEEEEDETDEKREGEEDHDAKRRKTKPQRRRMEKDGNAVGSHTERKKKKQKKKKTEKPMPYARSNRPPPHRDPDASGRSTFSPSPAAPAIPLFRSLPLSMRQLLTLRLVAPLLARTRQAGVVIEVLYVVSLLVQGAGGANRFHATPTRPGVGRPVAWSRKNETDPLRHELGVLLAQLLQDVLLYFQFGGKAAKQAVEAEGRREDLRQGEEEEDDGRTNGDPSTMAADPPLHPTRRTSGEGEGTPRLASSSSSPLPPPCGTIISPTISLLLPSFQYHAEVLSLVIGMVAEGMGWDVGIAAAAGDLFRVLLREWVVEGFSADDAGAAVKKEILHLGARIWMRLPPPSPSSHTASAMAMHASRREKAEGEAPTLHPTGESNPLPSLPAKFNALFLLALELGCRDKAVEVQEEARFLLAMWKAAEEEEDDEEEEEKEEETHFPPTLHTQGNSSGRDGSPRPRPRPRRGHREWLERMKAYVGHPPLSAFHVAPPPLRSSLPLLSNPFTLRPLGPRPPSASWSTVRTPLPPSLSALLPAGRRDSRPPATFLLGSTIQCGQAAAALC